MNEKEYREKIAELNSNHEKAKRAVQLEFAVPLLSVGDVATDNTKKMRVDTIDVTSGGYERLPDVEYSGPVLTAKGEPRKDGWIGVISQRNLVVKNGN